MKIYKKSNKYKLINNLLYYKNIKKQKLSKFNILFLKSGLILY